MTSFRRALVFVSAFSCACSADLTAPDGAVITCGDNGACPTDYKCDTATNHCFDTRVSLPQTFIAPVQRQVGDVSVNVTLASSAGGNATMSGEYDLGDGFRPASLDAEGLHISATGAVNTITWHAGADIGDTTYRTGVVLKLTTSSDGHSGPAATSDPFALGDDAPVTTNVALAGTPPFGGNIIVGFTVADSAADAIAVTKLEVSYDGNFDDTVVAFDASSNAASVIPSGAITNLQSSTDGTAHSFTWASSATSVVDAPSARIRLTLSDPFLAAAPADSPAFDLFNQIPPRVVGVTSAVADLRATGATPVSYRLIDDNGDSANVVVEYSLDGGTGFLPCTEYRVPESEGTFGLAATPAATGGVEHVFVWDPTGVSLRSTTGAVYVRVRADTPSDSGQIVPFLMGAGAPLLAPYTVSYASAGSPPAISATAIAGGDFNGDGLVDVVTSNGAAHSVLPATSMVTPAFASAIAGPAATSAITAMSTADVNGDGADDIVFTLANGLAIRTSQKIGTNPPSLGPSVTAIHDFGSDVPSDTAIADFDGDGKLDIATLLQTSVAVFFGDGTGAFSQPASVVVNNVAQMVAAQASAAAELWVLQNEAAQIVTHLTPTRDRTSVFVSRDLPLTTRYNIIAAGDFDGNGTSDVVLGHTVHSDADVYTTAADGSLEPPSQLTPSVQQIVSMIAADVDNDGYDDLMPVIDVGIGANQLFLAYNVGNGAFGPQFAPALALPTQTGQILSAFIKRARGGVAFVAGAVGDGSPPPMTDLVYTTEQQAGSGIGGGVFAAPVSHWNDGKIYTEYAVADFDNDGYDEHLFNGGTELHLWFTDGVRGLESGALLRATTIPCPTSACAQMVVGDSNGDGRVDIWVSASGTPMYLVQQADGTFTATAAPASAPTGFSGREPLTYTASTPTADLDGDGIEDEVNGVSGMKVYQGSCANECTTTGPSSISGTAAQTFSTTGPNSKLFATDINDDGLVDIVHASSKAPGASSFSIFFGQNESSAQLSMSASALASTPSGVAAVSATSTDLVGANVTLHVARAAPDDVVDWKASIIAAGFAISAARELTAPYEAVGDTRLTTVPGAQPDANGHTALRSEARLGNRVGVGDDFSCAGLDATNQRALVIDMPVIGTYTLAETQAATNHVYVRVTTYTGLDSGRPRRAPTWTEIPHDSDGDLTTGSGARWVGALGANGRPVVRVLTDKLGVFAAFVAN